MAGYLSLVNGWVVDLEGNDKLHFCSPPVRYAAQGDLLRVGEFVLMPGLVSRLPYFYRPVVWTPRVEASEKRQLSEQAELLGVTEPEVVVFGGLYDDTWASAFSFNPRLNKWRQEQPMPLALDEHAVCVDGKGQVFVLGGYTNWGERLQIVHCYNIESQSWRRLPDMLVGRTLLGACFFEDRLYVAGGKTGTNFITRAVEVFDGVSWESLARPMHQNRAGHGIAVVNQRIYVFGGRDQHGRILACTEYYSNGLWHRASAMHSPREKFGIAVHKHCVYVLGGKNFLGRLSEFECYDTQTDTWTVLGHMPKRSVFPAVVLLEQDLYVIGGSDLRTLDAVERYHIPTGVWTSAPSLPVPRWGHAAVAVVTSRTLRLR